MWARQKSPYEIVPSLVKPVGRLEHKYSPTSGCTSLSNIQEPSSFELNLKLYMFDQ